MQLRSYSLAILVALLAGAFLALCAAAASSSSGRLGLHRLACWQLPLLCVGSTSAGFTALLRLLLFLLLLLVFLFLLLLGLDDGLGECSQLLMNGSEL